MSYHYARKPAQHVTPATSRDETPATPCAADVAARREVKKETGVYPPSPFDVLMDKAAGIDRMIARSDALGMCRECPIQPQCHAENADEDWVWALSALARRPKNEVQAAKAVSRHRRTYEMRLATLTELVDQEGDLRQACGQLEVSRDGLWKWCSKYGHLNLWKQLSANAQVSRTGRARKNRLGAA